MSYQVLARKYRPQTFEEIIGQGHITRTLKNAIAAKRIAHGFLFSGMRGVGKTTLARVLAKALNCADGPSPSPCNRCDHCIEITQGYSVDVIEIDGASNTGVDDVRELRENVLYTPARTRYKIYIIDEVHMLSKSAFNALLKTLEEPPPHVIFIFATTEPHKVPITIQSRCQCFDFRKIPLPEIERQLLHIATQEGFALDEGASKLIARASEGSMRDAQSLLDQVVSFCGTEITAAETKKVLGVVDQEILETCTRALVEQDAEGVLKLVEALSSGGHDFVEFCKALQSHLRNLLMIKILKDPGGVTSLSGGEIEQLKSLTQRLEEDRLIAYVEHLNRVEDELRRSTYPRYLLEVALVKMARIQPLREFRQILSELESLEERLSQTGTSAGEGRPPALSASKEAESVRFSTTTAAPLPTEVPTMNWESMVQRAHEISPPEGSVLEQGFLEVMEGERFVIGFKNRLHYDRAEKKKEKILQIFKEMLHRDLSLEFSLHEKSEASPPTLTEIKKDEREKKREKIHRESMQHRVIQEAVKIFHGRVMEVREYS